jgi:hypothetical protein
MAEGTYRGRGDSGDRMNRGFEPLRCALMKFAFICGMIDDERLQKSDLAFP